MSKDTATTRADERSDLYLAYVVSHEAWYSSVVDGQHITVMHASTGGGVDWEFTITRVPDIGIKLGMFADSWQAFEDAPELFIELRRLAPETNLDEVREVLDRLGFKDDTERVRR